MDIDLALLADAATIDASGKLNILGVFERIIAPQFPVQHGRLALVVRFIGGPTDIGSHVVGIRLAGPGGELVRVDGNIQVAAPPPGTSEALRVPQVFNFDGVVFQDPGLFTFEIQIDGKVRSRVVLEVLRVPAPFQVQGAPPGLPPLPEGRGFQA